MVGHSPLRSVGTVKLLLWTIALVLLGAYIAVGWAVLHPHYTPAYEAFFIRRDVSDYETEHYAQTAEEGIDFTRPGLPSWVKSVHGFSIRGSAGRWTDEDFGNIAGLDLSQPFDGDVCVEFTAWTTRWLVGRTVAIRFGEQEQPFRIETDAIHRYRFEFTQLEGAKRLDLAFPQDIPPVIQLTPANLDTRRVGLMLMTLRVLPGRCSAP